MLRNIWSWTGAVLMLIASMSADSAVTTPPDQPAPICSVSGTHIGPPDPYGSIPASTLIYRVTWAGLYAAGCNGRAPGYYLYDQTISYVPTAPVRSYTACVPESASLRCFGSPVASSPSIKYKWEFTGPLTITYPSTPKLSNNVLISCAGTGSGTLKLTAEPADGNASMSETRTITCN